MKTMHAQVSSAPRATFVGSELRSVASKERYGFRWLKSKEEEAVQTRA